MAGLSTCPPLTRASVVEAHERIRGLVHRTPVLTNRTIDEVASRPRTEGERKSLGITIGSGSDGKPAAAAHPKLRLWFKCENLQRVGAFKARGAFHALARLQTADPSWDRKAGVLTHSSGNHAQALALAAREAGVPAHIVMPRVSAAPKVAATRDTYGAHVVFSGSTAAEREAMAEAVHQETGARLVPPYDHPDIILGQGTAGLELQAQVAEAKAGRSTQAEAKAAGGSTLGASPSAFLRAPSTETLPGADAGPGLNAIITPCGGGGLLAGTVLSAEGTGIRVFGAEPSLDGADDCARGLAQGQRIPAVKSLTIADGLRTPVGVHNWAVLTGTAGPNENPAAKPGGGVATVYAVSEDQIKAALRLLLERFKLVVEPSSAVPLAVALYNEEFRRLAEREGGAAGWDVGIVLSGGNVGLEALGGLFGSN